MDGTRTSAHIPDCVSVDSGEELKELVLRRLLRGATAQTGLGMAQRLSGRVWAEPVSYVPKDVGDGVKQPSRGRLRGFPANTKERLEP